MNVSHTKQLEILSLASEENKEFTEFVLKQNLQSDEQKIVKIFNIYSMVLEKQHMNFKAYKICWNKRIEMQSFLL